MVLVKMVIFPMYHYYLQKYNMSLSVYKFKPISIHFFSKSAHLFDNVFPPITTTFPIQIQQFNRFFLHIRLPSFAAIPKLTLPSPGIGGIFDNFFRSTSHFQSFFGA